MADSAAIEALVEKLHWLGHDAFRIDGPQGPIYFDPIKPTGQPAASLILISHDHFDHCVPDDVAALTGPDTVIVTEPDSAAKLTGDVRTMAPGDTLDVAGVSVTAVPAYNTDKEFHPRSNAWLGFVVTIDGVSVYHAGDTDHIPEMAELDVDIALLPVSGTYVMTADQAVEAALAINPRLAIPMHYADIVGTEDDAAHFAKSLEGKVPVRVLSNDG